MLGVKTFIKIVLVLVVCGIAGFYLLDNGSSNFLHFEPNVVHVQGLLELRKEYGPPNFGETPKEDVVIQVPILKPNAPVNVRGDPKSDINRASAEDVTEMQVLMYAIPVSTHQKYFGTCVSITGTLFTGHTGHHHTDVLITAQKITPAECK